MQRRPVAVEQDEENECYSVRSEGRSEVEILRRGGKVCCVSEGCLWCSLDADAGGLMGANGWGIWSSGQVVWTKDDARESRDTEQRRVRIDQQMMEGVELESQVLMFLLSHSE